MRKSAPNKDKLSPGKIVEHWDAIQKIPDESKSGNPMY